MSTLKLYFATDFLRNVWHLLLLVSALIAIAFTVVDLVFITREPLPISLSMLGVVVLGLLCLRKAAGCVRYWSSFLWLGLFLLSTGFTILPTSYSGSSYYVTYQLFYLLGSILLLVFFWNLGNLDRRILAPLFLIFTIPLGMMFFSSPGRSTADVRLAFGYTVGFIIYFVFYSLCAITAVNSNKLLKLPGFRWLFAGFSFFLFGLLAICMNIFFFENDTIMRLLFYMGFLIYTSPVLLIVGAALFTLKMDPAQLEERVRKAAPAKEVDSDVKEF